MGESLVTRKSQIQVCFSSQIEICLFQESHLEMDTRYHFVKGKEKEKKRLFKDFEKNHI